MSETYSFVRLRELVEAKIARKLSLRAELAAIDEELKDAFTMLADIPSLERLAMVEIPAAPAPPVPEPGDVVFLPALETKRKKRKDYRKMVVRVCAHCQQERTMPETNKYCSRPCHSAGQSKRQQDAKDRRLAAEVDGRLA
jgi:hypothetical protein